MADSDNASDSQNELPLDALLGSLSLGPSWVKEAPKPPKEYPDEPPPGKGGGRREWGAGGAGRGGGGGGGGAPRRDGYRDGRGGGPRGGGGGRSPGGRRGRGPDRESYERREAPVRIMPEEGVDVKIRPLAAACDVLAKQILHGARVHSLLDVSRLLLHGRERYELVFSVIDPHQPLFFCRRDPSLWVSEGDALQRVRNALWIGEFYLEETVEVDPPRGNFTGVARCGLSGELIAPPNFHDYQSKLRALHRERFERMPFERYQAKVHVEPGEAVVEEWKATQSTRRQWKTLREEEESVFTSWDEVEAHFRHHYFGKVFKKVSKAVLPGSVAAVALSPSLLESVKTTGGHVRKHPAVIISDVCRQLDRRHVPVFKKKGKLFTGPARPHVLKSDVVLAERPAVIMEVLKKGEVKKLADLWPHVLPTGQETPNEEWSRDFLWLIKQGHLLLTHDDRLFVVGE